MKKWNVIFALFLIPLMYQNCSSKVNFETINSSLNKDGLSDSADDPNINNTNNVEIPYDPPAGPVEIISAEEVVDAIVEDETTNNEDIPQDVGTPDLNIDEDFYKCENYVEVQPDTNIVIPERNSNGTCYYVRLLKQVPSHKSGDFGEAREETVISRNHDGSGNINPYILGQIELSLSSLGNRKVAISGALDDPNAVLKIDNYFLIQVSTTESTQRWAYGTSDSEPKNGPILVNGEGVQHFYSFAGGGTAQVTAIDMTSSVPQNKDLTLSVKALDCGGYANTSDAFLIFY